MQLNYSWIKDLKCSPFQNLTYSDLIELNHFKQESQIRAAFSTHNVFVRPRLSFQHTKADVFDHHFMTK